MLSTCAKQLFRDSTAAVLAHNNNNNNEYLERLTCTGPKRLHVLYKYILSKFNAYNMNAHTHTHARTHKELISYFFSHLSFNLKMIPVDSVHYGVFAEDGQAEVNEAYKFHSGEVSVHYLLHLLLLLLLLLCPDITLCG